MFDTLHMRSQGELPLAEEAGVVTVKQGFAPNAAVTLAVLALTTSLAWTLDSLGFPEDATIVLFVLGVLITAVITEKPRYSLVASVLSVFAFNFFVVDPHGSLHTWGPNYAETFIVMLAVAWIATYLVAKMRSNGRALLKAQMRVQNEQMRSDLLRSVSHDLRTPLTSIMGNADLLLASDGTLPDETRIMLAQNIRDDAAWLVDVVENLLAVTRADEESIQLRMRPELVDDVIEEALHHVHRDVSGHTVEVIPSNELLLVNMDVQLIVQVVVNLVNNALSHTPEGSTIIITTRSYGDEVAVTVEDDGPGIASENVNQVFDAFFTTEGALNDGRRGIGLGLSLCKTIVEAHGGRIWVENVKPHGAAFTFTLPLEEVPEDV